MRNRIADLTYELATRDTALAEAVEIITDLCSITLCQRLNWHEEDGKIVSDGYGPKKRAEQWLSTHAPAQNFCWPT